MISSVHLNRMFGIEALNDCQDCRVNVERQPYSLFVGVDFNKYQSFEIPYIYFNEVFYFGELLMASLA